MTANARKKSWPKSHARAMPASLACTLLCRFHTLIGCSNSHPVATMPYQYSRSFMQQTEVQL